MIEVVPASPRHVNTIAKRMADMDRKECAVFGHDPKQALRLAIMRSYMAWTVLIDGRPEAMFGVTTLSLIDQIGRPWLLMTDVARRQPISLVRLGRVYTEALHKQYVLLHNWVHADNSAAIRWLARLGFMVGPVDVVAGQPMRAFTKCAIPSPLPSPPLP